MIINEKHDPSARTKREPGGGVAELRTACHGLPPLHARLEDWMVELLLDQPATLDDLVSVYGSPLNIVSTAPLQRNLQQLNATAQEHGMDFRPYFARKANKCLAFVDAAVDTSSGVDVASEQECRQAIQRGVPGDAMICTAAVKSESLLRFCSQHGVTVAVDNFDELHRLAHVSANTDHPATRLAIRLSGFTHQGAKLHSRFGFDIDAVNEVMQEIAKIDTAQRLQLVGLHFHLDGYCPEQRVSAISQCLPVVDRLRQHGHALEFLDIGGGIPMSYLESASQWNDFWEAHAQAVLGQRPEITYRNHGLGFSEVNGELHGKRNLYPYYQEPVQAGWLSHILSSPCSEASIADAISSRSLQLRCEPGRSVLDGCGVTTARVKFVKQHHGGDCFVGLAMNRTQCRTGSDDFLVDPIVLSPRDGWGQSTQAGEATSVDGYLVGAYCTESDLLSLRKLRFPRSIAAGDLVVFPNTAGYFMHFLESRSHQFPLAKNLVLPHSSASPFALDDIDAA